MSASLGVRWRRPLNSLPKSHFTRKALSFSWKALLNIGPQAMDNTHMPAIPMLHVYASRWTLHGNWEGATLLLSLVRPIAIPCLSPNSLVSFTLISTGHRTGKVVSHLAFLPRGGRILPDSSFTTEPRTKTKSIWFPYIHSLQQQE